MKFCAWIFDYHFSYILILACDWMQWQNWWLHKKYKLVYIYIYCCRVHNVEFCDLLAYNVGRGETLVLLTVLELEREAFYFSYATWLSSSFWILVQQNNPYLSAYHSIASHLLVHTVIPKHLLPKQMNWLFWNAAVDVALSLSSLSIIFTSTCFSLLSSKPFVTGGLSDINIKWTIASVSYLITAFIIIF